MSHSRAWNSLLPVFHSEELFSSPVLHRCSVAPRPMHLQRAETETFNLFPMLPLPLQMQATMITSHLLSVLAQWDWPCGEFWEPSLHSQPFGGLEREHIPCFQSITLQLGALSSAP